MSSLLINIPTLEDSTSFYRGMGPLAALKRENPGINYIMMDKYNWATLSSYNAIFFQRPYTKNHFAAMALCKEEGMKIWVDYDDFLLDVPTDNPTYPTYNKQDTKNNVIGCIKMADIITVSTHELKRQLEKYNKNILVLPNGLHPKFVKRRMEGVKRTTSIAWRGSLTHQRDVMGYAKEIIEMNRNLKYKDWLWYFVGCNNWFITDYMDQNRTLWYEALDVNVYHDEMVKIAPSALMVPLHENLFNKCKSNIAWIESTYFGSVTIAPDMEEWRRPGALLYKNPEEFKFLLESVMDGNVEIERQVKESWDDILENYNLAKINLQRREIICDILGITKEKIS